MNETKWVVRRRVNALMSGALIAAIAMSAASAALAQNEASTPPSADAPAAKSAAGTPAVVLDDNGVESLLGKDVKNASGDKLGRIVDVLVSRDGELRAAVIDFGGFLGVGTRKVAVAWPTLRFSGDGPVLNMSSDDLRVTPEYRAGEPVVVVGPTTNKADPSPQPSPPPE